MTIRHSIVIALVNLLLIGTAQATDFSYTPSARTMMRADSNVRGGSTKQESAWGFEMGGGTTLRAQNDEWLSELIPNVNIRRFPIGNNLDSDGYSVAFNNDWKRPGYVAGLDFSYSRDSTLGAETTETGIKNDVIDRDSIQLQPSATWFATDRLSLQGSFLFSDISFLKAGNTGFVDYRYLQGSAGANYLWQDDLQVFANFFVSDFSVPSLSTKTRSYGGQTGATWKWDQSLEITGAMGWISSDVEFLNQQLVVLFVPPPPHFAVISTPETTNTSGPIASATIRKNFETVTAKLDYSRQVSPSGRGVQSSADRIYGTIGKKFSNRLALEFDGLYEMRELQAQDITANASALDLNHDYTELRGIVRYRFAPEWTISATYRFAHSIGTNVGNSTAVNGHSVYLVVDFNGLPKMFWNGL